MGQPSPGDPLCWTGERCIPGQTGADTYYEHLHRYLFACRLAAGASVLDIGSGEGYGSSLLARVATRVVGIDIDAPSIAHSSARYETDRVRFLRAGAEDLAGLEDHSFDVVVCLELIEHLALHDELIASVKRVMRRDGLLVLSTPDRDVYTTETYHNPFHVRELNAAELRDLLAANFRHHILYRQTLSSGSLMVGPQASGEPSWPFVGRRVDDLWLEGSPDSWPYLLAVASDGPIPQLPPTSTLHDNGLELVRELQRSVLASDQGIASCQAELSDARQQVYEWRRRYDAVVSTRRWRIATRAVALGNGTISGLARLIGLGGRPPRRSGE